ncbi:unnamed protein product [Didymodactylos carnosus]|uniref:dolichol kinase n=1 Tax=Didymodactylos carnosus TaxID=1234261 RepID=A0A8S2JHV1_9BILA|nr:unnamed protein product [Didymodactylos carnosus]CAF3810190.1 unnamed protein product [Didymodactylos carnosus]
MYQFRDGTSYKSIDVQCLIVLTCFLLNCAKPCRIKQIYLLGQLIQSAWSLYEDEKDLSSLFTVPHIFLIIGLSYSLWLADDGRYLAQLSDIVTIGIGNSCASIFGSKIGKHKWPNTKRSFEGTLANLLSQFLFIIVLWTFDILPYTHLNLVVISAGITLICLIETFCRDIDNLIIIK